jgi:predicted HD phosphohydrolase
MIAVHGRALVCKEIDMKALFFASVTLVLCGCAASPLALQDASSGAVGCSASSITVADHSLGATTQSWTATCNDGQKYFCSATDMLRDVKCSKASPK